ncbi:hypothetical protein JD969_00800 [Planctomycetota bacterium]|nr:hypothetical protein JD969_00800 [Planctomycetota bacterium]
MTASSPTIIINQANLEHLAQDLLTKYQAPSSSRIIIAIAGPPGSGKSTFASMITKHLNILAQSTVAAIVPMDGFHLTNSQLQSRNLTHLKGAPQTFDTQAYLTLIQTLKNASSTEYYPTYDRSLHEPVLNKGSEHLISSEIKFIITEGNYLLLDQPPWSEIHALYTQKWFLKTSLKQCENWLYERHTIGSSSKSQQQANLHIKNVDKPNINLVNQNSVSADLNLTWPAR